MYDIVKTKIVNGKVRYYAFADNDEDEYVSNLTNLEKNNSAEKSLPGKTSKAYEAKYFDARNSPGSAGLALDRFPGAKIFKTAFLYSSVFKDIFSPPPNRSAS